MPVIQGPLVVFLREHHLVDDPVEGRYRNVNATLVESYSAGELPPEVQSRGLPSLPDGLGLSLRLHADKIIGGRTYVANTLRRVAQNTIQLDLVGDDARISALPMPMLLANSAQLGGAAQEIIASFNVQCFAQIPDVETYLKCMTDFYASRGLKEMADEKYRHAVNMPIEAGLCLPIEVAGRSDLSRGVLRLDKMISESDWRCSLFSDGSEPAHLHGAVLVRESWNDGHVRRREIAKVLSTTSPDR